MNVNLKQRFQEILEDNRILEAELMSRHTTFRIGGPADFFLVPENADEIRRIIAVCKEKNVPYFILGNGSNLLVSDKGYQGVVVQLYRNFGQIRVEDSRIHAQAGALLSGIAAAAREASLTGFEFAGGIPGTLGGAVVMNAGAYGGEMRDIIETVTVLDETGVQHVLSVEELELGYRTSCILKKHYIVTQAVLKLAAGEEQTIRARMKELATQRAEKQPLEYPSAGSTFKRPEGYFAGKLIQDCGLKGFRVGDAVVSEKHSGFVINAGQATAADVMALIRHVQQEVEEKFHVRIEPEVRLLGEF